jgi:hypothetical protein
MAYNLSEMDDLRLFLQERLQAFDPGVDTSIGSTFDTEVIQPLITRLGPDPYTTPIREFLLSRLSTEFPDLVIQDGEPLDDLVIKPSQILLEPFRRQIEQVKNNQSLADPVTLNENEADALGANFFAKRRQGDYATGVSRLYFSSPQKSTVTSSNLVSDGSGHQFTPTMTQSIESGVMLFNIEDNLYFFDISVRAIEPGESYNIGKNTLISIEGLPSVVKVTNKNFFEGGEPKESTEQFIARVRTSLTEKSLVTSRGIDSRVKETFDSIRFLQVIGNGDPEMARDILKGTGETSPYAWASLIVVQGSKYLTLNTLSPSPFKKVSGLDYYSFIDGGVSVGDKIQLVDMLGTTGIQILTVLEVVSHESLLVDEEVLMAGTTLNTIFSKATSSITISDIPGGILVPQTPYGEVIVDDNQVHIGGMVDVYVRAGDPFTREIILEAIRDGEPVRFGIDMQSFGGYSDRFIQVTEAISGLVLVPSKDRYGATVTNHMLIKQYGSGVTPWKATENDVDRYIQLLGPVNYGTYKITSFLGDEYYTDPLVPTSKTRVTRIQVDRVNQESGSMTEVTFTSSTAFTGVGRLVEKISIKSIVRDLDGSKVIVPAEGLLPAITSGADLIAAGVTIGDSVVIETGDDSGIYSIRRVLSWLGTGDTLVLDRDLTKTLEPTGFGDGSGLRYRVSNELNVNLIDPKIVKIPLGGIFLGNDLGTVAGSSIVTVGTSTNFLLAGVEAGDSLEIFDGDNKGVYTIVSVTGVSATLDRAAQSTYSDLTFSVYRSFTGVDRPLVKVKSIELLDSNLAPTGVKVPYGKVIDARILGTLSNKAEGTTFESYSGELESSGGKFIKLLDSKVVDFAVDESVIPGQRLNILSGSSIGSYVIESTTGNSILIHPAAGPVKVFAGAETQVRYSIGSSSAGYLRMYFLEPTSVEVDSGLYGEGRVTTAGTGAKEFLFSEVPGYKLLPPVGSGDDTYRDLRVVRSYDVGGGKYNSILEFTDLSKPGVFEQELQEGDVLNINEQLQFVSVFNSVQMTFPEAAIFGSAAGLLTVAGSNRVSVPSNSAVDFMLMDSLVAMSGQTLIIDSGPDAGSYKIEKVENSKTLLLDRVMTSTTESIVGVGLRNGFLSTSGSDVRLTDPDYSPGTMIGEYITITESTRPDVEGTYEILEIVDSSTVKIDASSIPNPTNKRTLVGQSTCTIISGWLTDGSIDFLVNNVTKGDTVIIPEGKFVVNLVYQHQLVLVTNPVDVSGILYEIEATSAVDPMGIGNFTWVHTRDNLAIPQPFHVYRSVPTEATVLSVATKRTDVVSVRRGSIIDTSRFSDPDMAFDFTALTVPVSRGDILEILSGDAAGQYPIISVLAHEVTIQGLTFPFVGTNIPYRIWGGLNGSTRMVTVGPKDSYYGKIEPGYQMPYVVLRKGIARVSSTEMQDLIENGLYYADFQIESLGSGDTLNLPEATRMLVASGVTVQGYTYKVVNNTLTFSPYEEVSLVFDRRFLPVGNSDSPENLTEVSGRNLKVNYDTSATVQLVNDIMRSESDRPVTANPIARHFLPAYVYTTFQYKEGPSETEASTDLEDFINHRGGLDELVVSDLEYLLTKKGAVSVKHPILLTTVTHDIDRNLVVDRSGDRLGGSNEVPYNGTGRTTGFIAITGEGLIVTKEG